MNNFLIKKPRELRNRKISQSLKVSLSWGHLLIAEAGRKQSIHLRGNRTSSDLSLRSFALALWDLLFTYNRALPASGHRRLSLSSHLVLALVPLAPAPAPNKVIAVSKHCGDTWPKLISDLVLPSNFPIKLCQWAQLHWACLQKKGLVTVSLNFIETE